MRLSDTTRYGLRALAELAREPERMRSVRELCAAQRIPYKYLGRLMITLREAGLVSAVRGKRGGYRLARTPGAVTLEQVVGALQGTEEFQTCMLGLGTCALEGHPCALHGRMEPIRDALLLEVRTTTLADLVTPGPMEPEPPTPGRVDIQTRLIILKRS